FVLTPELSQEVAESAEPGHQNSAASASSCKNGFVFWLFAIGELLVPGAIREKGRTLLPESRTYLEIYCYPTEFLTKTRLRSSQAN
ncbi:MAG: hypothetical protein ACREH8_17695, partial [Opitutaceae bacterium]